MSNAANGESQAARPRVLIVDSNAATVEDVATTVRGEGYSVLKALTFEDGRRLWRSLQPEVLIVDIRLGQYNGLQLLMRARFDRPDLTGIVTSPVPDRVLEAEAVKLGGTFLLKPVSALQLLDAIRTSATQPPVATPPLLERRCEDRRRFVTQDFIPERRVGPRRRPFLVEVRRAAPTASQQPGPDRQQPAREDPGQDGATRRSDK